MKGGRINRDEEIFSVKMGLTEGRGMVYGEGMKSMRYEIRERKIGDVKDGAMRRLGADEIYDSRREKERAWFSVFSWVRNRVEIRMGGIVSEVRSRIRRSNRNNLDAAGRINEIV